MGHEKETPGHETLLLVSILSMQTARDERAVKLCKTITSALDNISQEKCYWNSKSSFCTSIQEILGTWKIVYDQERSFAMEGKEIMFDVMKLYLSSRLVSSPSLYWEYQW